MWEVVLGLHRHEVDPGCKRLGLLSKNGCTAEIVAVDIYRGVWRRGHDLEPCGLGRDGAVLCAAKGYERQ